MVKTSIILWRVGKLNYARKEDVIIEFESNEKFDKEYIRRSAEDKVGFKLYDNSEEKQKQLEDVSKSFVDEHGAVEIRYHEFIK
jgi:hypothetical protein